MLYKDSGADNELDDIGQTSKVLIHYLDELEQDKADVCFDSIAWMNIILLHFR